MGVYAILTDPHARPGRVKVGYTDNLLQRIRGLYTYYPEVEALALWEGDMRDEKTAHTLASQVCRRTRITAGEIFD